MAFISCNLYFIHYCTVRFIKLYHSQGKKRSCAQSLFYKMEKISLESLLVTEDMGPKKLFLAVLRKSGTHQPKKQRPENNFKQQDKSAKICTHVHYKCIVHYKRSISARIYFLFINKPWFSQGLQHKHHSPLLLFFSYPKKFTCALNLWKKHKRYFEILESLCSPCASRQ